MESIMYLDHCNRKQHDSPTHCLHLTFQPVLLVAWCFLSLLLYGVKVPEAAIPLQDSPSHREHFSHIASVMRAKSEIEC